MPCSLLWGIPILKEGKMIKIGICDDERYAIEVLKDIIYESLERLDEKAQIISYLSGKEVFADPNALDLIFLDIEMPEIDGIKTGKILRRKNYRGKIIIATGKVERFKEAFSIEAFRFVTKPFQKEEIFQVLEDYFKARIGMEKICVYRERNEYAIYQRDILYAYSINSAVELYTEKGIYRMESSLSELEEKLDMRMFYRISKQYIVNMQEIISYRNGNIILQEKELKVSVRKKKEFEKTYKMFDANYR